LEIKQKISHVVLRGFDEHRPIRDTLHLVWRNLFDHISKHLDHLRYMEQFSNSPYKDRVDHSVLDSFFNPLFKVIQRGIAEKFIKDVDQDILPVFFFHPVMMLANSRRCKNFEIQGKKYR
jgi:hypothetical protein